MKPDRLPLVLTIVIGVLCAGMLIHSCALYSYERGCREAGGTTTRPTALEVTCDRGERIDDHTRARVVRVLVFVTKWLDRVHHVVGETGGPQTTGEARALEKTTHFVEEAKVLREELER